MKYEVYTCDEYGNPLHESLFETNDLEEAKNFAESPKGQVGHFGSVILNTEDDTVFDGLRWFRLL